MITYDIMFQCRDFFFFFFSGGNDIHLHDEAMSSGNNMIFADYGTTAKMFLVI